MSQSRIWTPNRDGGRNLSQVDPRLTIYAPKFKDSYLPGVVDQPIAWFCADDLDSENYKTSVGNPILAGGIWVDRAGTPHNTANTAGATAPSVVLSSFNGRHSLFFAGHYRPNVIATPTFAGSATYSAFVAFRYYPKADNFDLYVMKGATNVGWGINQDNTSVIKTAGTWGTCLGTASQTAYGYGTVLSVRVNGTTTSNLTINGKLQSTTVPGSNPVLTAQFLSFGGDPADVNTRPGNMSLAEFILYHTYLSDNDRAAVESYLGAKYGITHAITGLRL